MASGTTPTATSKRTGSRFPGVWVHGDWASADEDGYWFLHGRSDDTLNIAGKRIGPAELESAAVAHPAVREAAAIGVPHEVKGEVAWIFCCLLPGAETTEAEVAETVAAELGRAFKPERVLFVEALPKTRSAKIVRRAVRATAARRRSRRPLVAREPRIARCNRSCRFERMPHMTAIIESVEIARSPEDVFAYLDKLDRHGEWQPELVSSKIETEGPVRVGTRVAEVRKVPGGNRKMSYEITAHDPPRSSSFQGIDGPIRVVGTMTVEPAGEGRSGSRSTSTSRARGSGSSCSRSSGAMPAKRVPVNQAKLKERLESGA